MHPETESVLERRRTRRSLSKWRGAAIVALAFAAGAALLDTKHISTWIAPKQIARITIEGTITEDRTQLALLKQLEEADNVAAVIVFVNSPGGTTTGGEALYDALRRLAKAKPVVAQFGTVAASAGYIVGLGTDHIVARGNTITGSVGVIAQWPELVGLLDRIGVKVNEVKSGVLKASPSPFQPLDEGGRKVMEDTIGDGFRWFLSLVEERRGIKAGDITGLTDGRIFSGREAAALKLVDEIGGEREAQAWLETEKAVPKDLEIVDWKPLAEGAWGISGRASLAEALGLGPAASRVMDVLTRDPGLSTLGLDGLLSVWHPSEK